MRLGIAQLVRAAGLNISSVVPISVETGAGLAELKDKLKWMLIAADAGGGRAKRTSGAGGESDLDEFEGTLFPRQYTWSG